MDALRRDLADSVGPAEQMHAYVGDQLDVSRNSVAGESARAGSRWPLRLLYGSGAIASGVKLTPMTMLLMLYYNQVVGLSAWSVSLVLMISLIFDALFDPLLGHVSDGWRSRWGRRLPFMYASALPLPILFVLLWMPPRGWPEGGLLGYFAACLVGVRFFDTFFELPHIALVPELTADPQERTRLFTMRSFVESAAGLTTSLLAYNVFLKPRADGSGGVLSAEGYPVLALACGIAIFVSIVLCTVGLHRLAPPQPSDQITVRRPGGFRHVLAVVGDRSFLQLMLAAALVAMSSGVSSNLNTYMMIYYYKFSQAEISFITAPAMLAFFLVGFTPVFCMAVGKARSVALLCVVQILSFAIPILLCALDLAPPASPTLGVLVMLQAALGPTSIAMILIILSTMIADLVEGIEKATGQRSEGLLLSGVSFVRKLTSGVGTLAAGAILALSAFPQGAGSRDVDPATLDAMAMGYLLSKAAFVTLTIIVVLKYRERRRLASD